MPEPRQLLVAVHDVTPAHAASLDAVYGLLQRCGVQPYALFVVPDWHGSWPVASHAAFCADLRQRQDASTEVFLHGWRHDEAGLRRAPRHHLRAFGRTAREGEFLSLPPDGAAERIDRGLAALREQGLNPIGFVPPAWLHGDGLSGVLAGRGLEFTEDAWAAWAVSKPERVRAPAVRWSTRTATRARAGVMFARLRRPFDRAHRVVRLAIHPPDVSHPAVARSLEQTLAHLLGDRQPTSYRDVLNPA